MKELLVFGDKTFRIKVPDDAKITFGPWSPPKNGRFNDQEEKRGTLRIYSGKGKDDILAVFSRVLGFRDLSLSYQEKIEVEVGDTVWKDDQQGYTREAAVKRSFEWADPAQPPKQLHGKVVIMKKGKK